MWKWRTWGVTYGTTPHLWCRSSVVCLHRGGGGGIWGGFRGSGSKLAQVWLLKIHWDPSMQRNVTCSTSIMRLYSLAWCFHLLTFSYVGRSAVSSSRYTAEPISHDRTGLMIPAAAVLVGHRVGAVGYVWLLRTNIRSHKLRIRLKLFVLPCLSDFQLTVIRCNRLRCSVQTFAQPWRIPEVDGQ